MDLIEYVTKGAEAAGTNLMPTSVGPAAATRPSATKTIPKTGSDLRRVDSLVDTTGKEAPQVLYSKTAERYALPSFALYPLDNYAQVKAASAYFEEHAGGFDLTQRREFALNLVARSEELGLKVATRAQCYGSQLPANLTDLTIALDGRRGVVGEREQGVLDGIKQASADLPPEAVALLLSEFDQHAGIEHLYGHQVLDPYLSAFGVKTAEAADKLDHTPEGSIVIGNEYMSVGALKRFAAGWRRTLVDMYGDAMAKEFQKDPVGIFNSLPTPQRKVIMRMVNDNGPSEAISS